MKKFKNAAFITLSALLILGLLAIGPWCWQYSVNSWLGYFHKPETFTFLLACIPALFLAPFTIPVTVVTWLLMMFL